MKLHSELSAMRVLRKEFFLKPSTQQVCYKFQWRFLSGMMVMEFLFLQNTRLRKKIFQKYLRDSRGTIKEKVISSCARAAGIILHSARCMQKELMFAGMNMCQCYFMS